MADTALAVEVRDSSGKGVARKIRARGKIPAVLYGRGKPSVALTVDPRELERLLRGSEAGLNTLIDLQVPGSEGKSGKKAGGKVVLVKEIQRDPLRGSMLHVDLYEVDLTKTVTVEVPVQLVGRPQGVELGGVLEHSMREVEVECLPRAIPDAFQVDVSELDIGDVIHVRDLPIPEGVEMLSDLELAVALVSAPVVEEEAPAAEAVEGIEGEAVPAEGEAAAEAGEAKPEAGEGD